MDKSLEILEPYYNQKFAVVSSWEYHEKFRSALVECIKECNFEAKGYNKISEALEENPTCVIVISPMDFVVPPKNKDVIWVMVQTEQLFSAAGGDMLFFKTNRIRLKPYLKRYDLILETIPDNLEGIKSIAKSEVIFFPVGWYTDRGAEKQIPETEDKPFDLLFIGTLSPERFPRRKKILDYLSGKYKVYPKFDNIWEDEKAQAMASSKICLNIHQEESRCSEIGRLNDYFAYKNFVLSEPMNNPYPYKVKEDYDEFLLTNMCEKIDFYLAHPEERERIANHAYETLHSVTLLDSTKKLLDRVIMLAYSRELAQNTSWIRNKLFILRKSVANRLRWKSE